MQDHNWQAESVACLREIGKICIGGRKPDRLIGEPGSLITQGNATQGRIVEIVLEERVLERRAVTESCLFGSDIAILLIGAYRNGWQKLTRPSFRQQVQTAYVLRVRRLPPWLGGEAVDGWARNIQRRSGVEDSQKNNSIGPYSARRLSPPSEE